MEMLGKMLPIKVPAEWPVEWELRKPGAWNVHNPIVWKVLEPVLQLTTKFFDNIHTNELVIYLKYKFQLWLC
jgi:hypothetical protein